MQVDKRKQFTSLGRSAELCRIDLDRLFGRLAKALGSGVAQLIMHYGKLLQV